MHVYEDNKTCVRRNCQIVLRSFFKEMTNHKATQVFMKC